MSSNGLPESGGARSAAAAAADRGHGFCFSVSVPVVGQLADKVVD